MKRIYCSESDKQIFNDVKACFTEIGLPTTEGKSFPRFMDFMSELKNDAYTIEIMVMLDPAKSMVIIDLFYGFDSDDKRGVLYELFNNINHNLFTNHFTVSPSRWKKKICLQGGMHFTDDGINKQAFHMILKQLLSDYEKFAPLIQKQLESDEKPENVIKKFLEENKEIAEEFI